MYECENKGKNIHLVSNGISVWRRLYRTLAMLNPFASTLWQINMFKLNVNSVCVLAATLTNCMETSPNNTRRVGNQCYLVHISQQCFVTSTIMHVV